MNRPLSKNVCLKITFSIINGGVENQQQKIFHLNLLLHAKTHHQEWMVQVADRQEKGRAVETKVHSHHVSLGQRQADRPQGRHQDFVEVNLFEGSECGLVEDGEGHHLHKI